MYASFERFELDLPAQHAFACSRSGDAMDACETALADPYVANQLAQIDPEEAIKELWEYGAWDTDDLADPRRNCLRLIWLGAGQIADELGGFIPEEYHA